MNRTGKPFKYERRFAAQLEREEAWRKLMLTHYIQTWAQGDLIRMGDGRAYVVQRNGEWHKVVKETQ